MRKISVVFLLLAGSFAADGQTFTMGVGKNLGEPSGPNRLFSEPLSPSTKAKPNERALTLDPPEPTATLHDSPPPEAGTSPMLAPTLMAVVLVALGTGAWTIRRRALR